MSTVLIAGCGYLGTALGQRLASEGHAVWGLRRSGALPHGIRPIHADLCDKRSLRSLPHGLDFVFYAASPDRPDDEAYRMVYVEGLRNLLESLREQGQRPQRVFLASSTSVYGQTNGEWVDESSPTEPATPTAQRILEGERILGDGGFLATVLRSGGIYGPGRTRLVRDVLEETAPLLAGSDSYVNRIHRDDAVGVLCHLMNLPVPDSVYLGVDFEPSTVNEVLQWLANRLGKTVPEVAATQESVQFRSRSNKRCRNDRLVRSGYQFLYPTFREGYGSVLAEMGIRDGTRPDT